MNLKQSYQDWHNNPKHARVHWSLLVVTGVLVTLSLVSSINSAYKIAGASHGGAHITTHHDTIPDFCESPTKTSVGSGNWNNPSTWSGGTLPTTNDIVVINAGHTVTFDASSTSTFTCVGVKGTLTFRTDTNTRLTTGTLLVYDTGHLIVGTTSTPVNAANTAEIIIANKPFETFDPDQYGNGIIALGEVKMHGAVKDPTFIRVASEPTAGQTTLLLSQTPSGWNAGDRIFIPDSFQFRRASGIPYSGMWEEKTIQSISGNTITLDSALQFNHPGAKDGLGNPEPTFFPHVGNLQRNVIIKSENPSGTKGHVMFTHRADIDVRYVWFRELGRTTSEPLNPTTNHIGRYPLHIHHLWGQTTPQPNGYQFTLIGNAIDGGTATSNSKWGITVHGSHYGLIKDNVVYNQGGGGIVTEDGSESYNVFDHNFVVRTLNPGGRGDERQPQGDFGWTGDSFWFRGPNNYVRNNVAADATFGFGYSYWFMGASSMKIPKFQGADMTIAANYNVRTVYETSTLQIENNEYYGGAGNVMTYWWVCSEFHTPMPGCTSLIKDMKSWHHPSIGFYGYPTANIIIDGWKARNDRTVLTNVHEGTTSIWFGDYKSSNIIIRNADIQGFATGIFGPTFQHESFTIENSFLRNAQNILILTPNAPGSGPDGRAFSYPSRVTLWINNN